METVIKVSSTKPKESKEDKEAKEAAEAAAEAAEAEVSDLLETHPSCLHVGRVSQKPHSQASYRASGTERSALLLQQEEKAKEDAAAADKKEKDKPHSHLPWGLGGKSKAEKEKDKREEEEAKKKKDDAAALKRAQAPAKAKPRERRPVEANVEHEVDRIIDSQDNVYVLSKPKWGPSNYTLNCLASTVAVMDVPSDQMLVLQGGCMCAGIAPWA